MQDDAIRSIDGLPGPDQDFLDDLASAVVDAAAQGDTLDLGPYLARRPDLEEQILATFRFADSATSVPTTALPTIPGYDLLRLLGRGSAGEVFLARRVADGKHVAIKLLRDEARGSPGLRRRFVDEAAALARIDHPHVVSILDTFESAVACGYVMEWIDGASLAQVIQRCGRVSESAGGSATPSMPIDWSSRIVVAIARALSAVHRVGLVHRDVKPSNILIDARGSPKLSDFGLVRDIDEPHGTKSGWFVGTAPYAAPEQLRGEHQRVDARTDVYALGAVLYECLSDSPPFGMGTPTDILRDIEHVGLRSLRQRGRRVPACLDVILAKALAPDPFDRYAGADEFADDVERFLRGDPIRARREPLLDRWQRSIRRRPLRASILALTAILGTAGAFSAVYVLPRVELARKVEREESERIRTMRAWQELGEGHIRESLRCFEGLLAENPTDLVALTGAVIATSQAKEFAEAERFIDAASRLLNDDPCLVRLRIFVLRSAGRSKDADALASSVPVAVTSTDFLMDAELALASSSGDGAAAAGNALRLATEAIARAPSPSLFAHLIRCTAAARIKDRTVRDLAIATVLHLWPRSAEAHAGVGMILRREHELTEAERLLREAVRLSPEFVAARNSLGNTLQELGRLQEAQVEYRAIIAAKPDDAAAHYNLGNLLIRLEAWDEAIARFEEAEALDPTLSFARLNLGVALSGAGRHRDAIRQYLAYGGSAPSPRTLVNLALSYARVGDARKANEAVDRAIAVVGKQRGFARFLGHDLLLLGRFEEALPYLRIGVEVERTGNSADRSCSSWLADCERLVGWEAVLADAPAGPAAGRDLVERAHAAARINRHVTAARLFHAAFLADPGLTSDPSSSVLVSAAASAASGSRADAVDGDAAASDDRAHWATTAIGWLEMRIRQLTQDVGEAAAAKAKLAWSQSDVFAGIRDEVHLAELSAEARSRCREFWRH